MFPSVTDLVAVTVYAQSRAEFESACSLFPFHTKHNNNTTQKLCILFLFFFSCSSIFFLFRCAAQGIAINEHAEKQQQHGRV